MPRMNVHRSATAAWLLIAALAPTLAPAPALAQTPANTNPQSAPSGSGIAIGNPQQSLVGSPEPQSTGMSVTYGGEIDTKVQIDGHFNQASKGFAELYAKQVATAYVNLGSSVSVRAETTYERFRSQSATTAFNSQGLYLSQLYATYTAGPVTAYAGKIHPRFSVGYDRVPGIYDTFANDYEQKERIGFGALVSLAPAYGKHILSAETYFLDTSPLSRSLFAYPNGNDPAVLRPGRYRSRYGGPSNTGGFDSFDIALDGTRMPGLEQLKYHIAYTRQGVGQPGERAETGATAALSYEFKLTPRIAMTPFVEYAHFDNFAGAPGEKRDYLITAVEFDYRKYALSLAAAPRRVRTAPDGTRYDLQYTATVSYTIMPRLTVSAGYIRTRDTGVVANAVGSAVDYVLRF